MAQDRLLPGSLYEQARSAGLTHETALDVSTPHLARGPLSGSEWPELKLAAANDNTLRFAYAGRPATIDSALWLKKLGMALMSHVTWRALAAEGLPIITNCRVRLDDWHVDGRLPLDLEHLQVGGRRFYTTCRVPIGACIDHSTNYVLMQVLSHLRSRTIVKIENAILQETDLRHVAG